MVATLNPRQYYFFSHCYVNVFSMGCFVPKKIEFLTEASLLVAGVPLLLKKGGNMVKALLVYPTRISPELKDRLIVAAANLKTTPAALAREAIEQAVKLSESLETNSKNPIALRDRVFF